jgi:hypothetical protein
MIGQRFGRLLVKYVCDKKRKSWVCRCDCGRYVNTSEKRLRIGIRTACNTCQPLRKFWHGPNKIERQTRLGKCFVSAKKHCTYVKSRNYPNYGGRGIQFKFQSFKEWGQELGPCPDGYFLDRINPDGHYEKGNVRWVPRSVSCHNRRKYRKGPNSDNQHSQFRGVWRANASAKTWSALLQKDGVRHYLGTFSSEEEAGRAYDKKAMELFGQYAAVNFPLSICT